MKLLFDQNISFRIVKRVSHFFPECCHISDLGLKDASDTLIWEKARTEDFVIVPFDSDFFEMAILKGAPPKIIWLRMGNTSTDSLVSILEKHQKEINNFLDQKDYKNAVCLELFD